MLKAMVACRSGMGSSMLLKIKVEQVCQEQHYDMTIEHSNLDGLIGFKGDLVITMNDVAEEIRPGSPYYVIGIINIMDKKEINDKLAAFFEKQKES